MSHVIPNRMSPGLRVTLLAICGALWGSGCAWLVLHWFFANGSDFGPLEHPWQPFVLRLHGWLAVGSVFLLGWIAASHASEHWPRRIKRLSGVSTASSAAALVLTGYALYYTTDGLHDLAAAIHELLGAGAILLALTHWRRYRPRPAARPESPVRFESPAAVNCRHRQTPAGAVGGAVTPTADPAVTIAGGHR